MSDTGIFLNSLSDKTVLVTGSTDGVGRCVAFRLAAAGARVLVHGRNRARAERLIEEIAQLRKQPAQFYPADLSSLSETAGLADAVSRDHGKLDILINNAGIGTGLAGEGRKTSVDAHELRFAVNYLAGFLLTRRLLPLLRSGSPARVINVTSIGQFPIDFGNPMLERGYSPMRAYCQSKLAQIMFTLDLAAEMEGQDITANCLHPATYMNTTMVKESGIKPVSTVEEGGNAILFLAASSAMSGRTGLYFEGVKAARAHDQAYDVEARRSLRSVSEGLTRGWL